MLMECQECGKQISTWAEACPNCGFPVKRTDLSLYCNVNGTLYNFSRILELLPKVGDDKKDISPLYLVRIISDKTHLQWEEGEKLVALIRELNGIPESFNGKKDLS